MSLRVGVSTTHVSLIFTYSSSVSMPTIVTWPVAQFSVRSTQYAVRHRRYLHSALCLLQDQSWMMGGRRVSDAPLACNIQHSTSNPQTLNNPCALCPPKCPALSAPGWFAPADDAPMRGSSTSTTAGGSIARTRLFSRWAPTAHLQSEPRGPRYNRNMSPSASVNSPQRRVAWWWSLGGSMAWLQYGGRETPNFLTRLDDESPCIHVYAHAERGPALLE
ncbi:hypothetical protein BKA56DRAFT_717038 [Ilyonectria sp. MPI-CAGE-AT-0026]|nr:hypothetical protein BKA56DRAFT_717038 [Ilyonectria sp. MPI-CAGE-AT-0026]